jgi:hypothetical protein
MKSLNVLIAVIAVAIILDSCSNNKTDNKPGTTSKDSTKETFSLKSLVVESKQIPDSVIAALNAQHHSFKVIERRTLPGPFMIPKMKYYSEYAVTLDKLPVINPGPGEYVHVMSGQAYGYNGLTIGVTETFPGGAPPMHSHEGEEAHVLLEGEILYA